MASTSSQSQPGVTEFFLQHDIAPEIVQLPISTTHDTSSICDHAPSFESVSSRLRESVHALRKGAEEVMATRGRSRYQDVRVIMLSWAEDDLTPRVLPELTELGDMFARTYHYHVEYYQIPEDMPGARLGGRLLEFVGEFAKPENLLIVCYGGHAIQNPLRSEPPIWVSNRKGSARLPSSLIQAILAECASDVLLLCDCCHAAPTDAGVTGRGVTEVLAACGFEAIAAEVGKDSFTNALTEELGTSWHAPITIIELHCRLIQRLRNYKPGIAKDDSGKRMYDKNNNPIWERPRRRTPTYGMLTNEKRRRSIILTPLLPLQTSPESGLTGLDDLTPHGWLFGSPPRKRSRYQAEDDGPNCQSTPQARVLLSIRVSTPDFDIEAWKDWIRDLPPDGTDIQIDSAYDSFSTLLLVNMPITAWDLLPDDPSYSFISFVTSENLIPGMRRQDSEEETDGLYEHDLSDGMVQERAEMLQNVRESRKAIRSHFSPARVRKSAKGGAQDERSR